MKKIVKYLQVKLIQEISDCLLVAQEGNPLLNKYTNGFLTLPIKFTLLLILYREGIHSNMGANMELILAPVC